MKILMPLLSLFFLHITVGDAMELPIYAFEPHEFIEVKHMEGDKYPVSPEEPPELAYWRGIIISAPTKVIVRINKDTKYSSLQIPIPFCVFYVLGLPDINNMCAMELHLYNGKNEIEYKGQISCRDGNRRYHLPWLPYDSHPNNAASTNLSFHINKYVTLPMESAEYSFWTIAGETKSNTVQIEIEVIQE